jgi:hypothetical protein
MSVVRARRRSRDLRLIAKGAVEGHAMAEV